MPFNNLRTACLSALLIASFTLSSYTQVPLEIDTVPYSNELEPMIKKTLELFELVKEFPKTKKALKQAMAIEVGNEEVFHESICQAKYILSQTDSVNIKDFRFVKSKGYWPDETYLSILYQPSAYNRKKAEIVVEMSVISNTFTVTGLRGTQDWDDVWFNNFIDSIETEIKDN